MRVPFVVLTCVLTGGLLSAAQQKESAPQEKPAVAAAAPSDAKALVPLKVQIVLSRFRGDKKIGSLPYQIGVVANERAMTSVRMGIEVPVGRGSGQNMSVSYRSVGTNIDCLAQSAPGDAYKLAIVVEDSSVLAEAGDKATKPASEQTAVVSDMPAFRSFKSNFSIMLRDGQTTQYTSAVDPISGEVMKIDVTLNVIK
jgi:hypothetical protein